MSNSFGEIFRLTTFGESHGKGIGGVIDGCPPRVLVDVKSIGNELARRRPGQSGITTSRRESDEVEFLSGLYEGKTTGTPIAFIVRNEDSHSSDYAEISQKFRPSHADYTYQVKYGLRDPRGGGRSSARETVARCVAGAVAKQILRSQGIEIRGYTSQVGKVRLEGTYEAYDLSVTETNAVRCPDVVKALEMESLIKEVQADGDTVGGIVTCVIMGVPAGVGEPVFDKLQATLARAMLSINAAKGFDYGDGFDAPLYSGSQHNDVFLNDQGTIRTKTNYSGGIQGGISNGETIYFRVAFKAVATVLKEQETVTLTGTPTTLKVKGRHDPCVLPRAVPVVEAMAAITILDFLLRQKMYVE
ncbi:MAG: chorismate synthase [Tannerellaceae bacterium]|jgi:chorismate synthase|nr:chorismate synthase [Tannerellaceae bacterium]